MPPIIRPFLRKRGRSGLSHGIAAFHAGLIERLAAKGIGHAFLTLHVGAGTFLPVKADNIADHRMHAEWGEIRTETARRINETRAKGGRIIAVGTTVCRLLESAVDAQGQIQPFLGDTDIFLRPAISSGAWMHLLPISTCRNRRFSCSFRPLRAPGR